MKLSQVCQSFNDDSAMYKFIGKTVTYIDSAITCIDNTDAYKDETGMMSLSDIMTRTSHNINRNITHQR